MSGRSLRTALLAASALAAGCVATGAGRGSESQLVGCYQFRWDADARALGLPWGFELRPAPLEGWPALGDARVAVTRLTADRTADHPFGFWAPSGADSVRVGHPGGGGLALALGIEGRDLAGWGLPVGDALVPGEDAELREPRPVLARRVLCNGGGSEGPGRVVAPAAAGPSAAYARSRTWERS